MHKDAKNSVVLSVDHEQRVWSDLFKREINKGKKSLYSSYWWEDYYTEIKKIITPLLNKNSAKILEAGSGSGKASIVLGKSFDITLLDISSNALKYAKVVAKKFGVKNVKYVEGDINSMPFRAKSFDLVWNIGVIEHYKKKDALTLVTNMTHAVKKNGYITVGVPNFKSPQIIKARLLSSPKLKFLPGYRLDSEQACFADDIVRILRQAVKNEGRQLKNVEIHYVGKPLFVESPKLLVKTIGYLTQKLFPNRKFLILVTCKVN